ncbi:conserved membrane protein of unknown function [Rhodovastum atsumiense]|uniref:DUF4239 domain-containing protein n=1 Tax=Rhodovastum atsumiense TaxID=504468 RepID=A0A5M6IM52_9PROT|nr:DUF4239 domain-containing protein [Rhodovastum atsumiense]KAA5609330.1 DUF4239 domain-containing protein [Rhodovastum atsumiense]CAH2602370.1 conserved membrane protein of unknown function [Rhodovastum atsumiense]
MTYGVAVLIVLGSCLATLALSALAFRLLRVELRRRHHEVGSALFLQLGVIYAVLLAFVFSQVLADVTAAAEAVSIECGDLHAVAMLSGTLPPEQGARLREDIAAYLETVVKVEWPMMSEHHTASPDAVEKFRVMLATVSGIDAMRPQDAVLRDHMLTLLADAHARREMRVFQAGEGVPAVTWWLLIAFGVVLTLFVAMSGTAYLPTHLLFGVTFSCSISLILVAIGLLDYPFSGSRPLDVGDFTETLAKVREIGSSTFGQVAR